MQIINCKLTCKILPFLFVLFLLQDAILKYNAHYSKRWNFEALHSYFNEVTMATDKLHRTLYYTTVCICDISSHPLTQQMHKAVTVSSDMLSIGNCLESSVLITWSKFIINTFIINIILHVIFVLLGIGCQQKE